MPIPHLPLRSAYTAYTSRDATTNRLYEGDGFSFLVYNQKPDRRAVHIFRYTDQFIKTEECYNPIRLG